MLKYSLLFVVSLFCGYSADAATLTNASADAKVVNDLTIIETRKLDFGTFSVGASGGKVVVDNSGTTVSGDIIRLIPGDIALFTIKGEPNADIKVTGSKTVTLTRQGGSESMIADLPTNASTRVFKLAANGEVVVPVTGSLNVNPSQKAGTYTGQYSMTANY